MSGSDSPIRILAVDDHPLVRDGIAGLVGVQPDMTLVAQAANGREAIQQFRAHRPDVTLMDIQMPVMNGLDSLITIRAEFPEAKVIVHQREFESWYKSLMDAIQAQLENKMLKPLMYLDTPVLKPYARLVSHLTPVLYGPAMYDKENLRRLHTEIHDEVRRLVPKDRLLEFKLKQGWEPICQFLGRDIPKEPFPHLNDTAEFREKCYWMTVTGYQRLWKSWSSTVYLTGLAGFVFGIAKLNGFL